MAASRPSFPSEPNLRRLGVGGGGGGGDRILRAQLVIAFVLAFTILAVVMYLMRRPTGSEHAPVDGGADVGNVSSRPEAGGIIRTKLEQSKEDEKSEDAVSLGPVQRVKCSAGRYKSGHEGSLCDPLPFFEEALARAIKETAGCAPETGTEGTLNYVLAINFNHRRLRVFPGQSGKWTGPQAKKAAGCVLEALPAPQWDAIVHQYRYYMIAIMATYPAPDPLEGYPKFE